MENEARTRSNGASEARARDLDLKIRSPGPSATSSEKPAYCFIPSLLIFLNSSSFPLSTTLCYALFHCYHDTRLLNHLRDFRFPHNSLEPNTVSIFVE